MRTCPHRRWSTVITVTVANQDGLPSAPSPLAALTPDAARRARALRDRDNWTSQ